MKRLHDSLPDKLSGRIKNHVTDRRGRIWILPVDVERKDLSTWRKVLTSLE